MSKLSQAVMFKAFMQRDSGFTGLFVTAVKTTGIFCTPVCGAKKPKRENIEFYSSVTEAIRAGYRPCKMCNPLEAGKPIPTLLKQLLDELSEHPSVSLSDTEIKKRGIQPAALRRWFVKNYGITFHAYKRMTAMNRAFERLGAGETVTSVAFDSGYNSISGFTQRYRDLFGSAPSLSSGASRILADRINTPLGPMVAAVAENHLILLEFADRRMLPQQIKKIKKFYQSEISFGGHILFEELRRELEEYFSGKLTSFTVPVKQVGTAFQLAAWKELQQVPYGSTRSYSEQARSIGKTTAVRAVAQANGHNAVAIIVPCHRIIGENGKLTGYGGGLWRKAKLLELESGKTQNFFCD